MLPLKHIHRWAKQLSSNFKLILFFCLMLPALAHAEVATIKAMRINPSATNTKFTFVLTAKVPVEIVYEPEPDRVLAMFKNVRRQFTMTDARLGGSNVTSISSLDAKDNLIVFSFSTDVKPEWKGTYQEIKNSTDVEYVLEIMTPSVKKITSLLTSPDSIRHELLASISSATKKIMKSTKVDRKLVIVIDPGHGGRDTGAIGKNGIKEKTIVLSVARQLADNINKSPRMRAVLTRPNDRYVSLRKRLQIARKNHADLFIAIHADAYLHDRASGASIYALSPQGATSEAARWLAQQENHSELGKIELNELADQSAMLRSIMIDLAQTATIRDSLHLGREVIDALDNFSKMHRAHVEQAPFVVLKSPDIPSILVETGFITNPKEEKRLTDKDYQKKLADAIYSGINTYFQSRYYLTMSHAMSKNIKA